VVIGLRSRQNSVLVVSAIGVSSSRCGVGPGQRVSQSSVELPCLELLGGTTR
jgi:hypothetical protein